MSGGSRQRRIVRQAHLWMGLSVGGLFALIALTGSLLVFYPAIDRLMNPAISDDGTATLASYDAALATLRHRFPDKAGPWRIEVTGQPGAIPARYYNPPETAGRAFAPMMVWLSSDGRHVLRREWWGDYAVTFVYDLHYRLLSGTVGGIVVGYLGLASLTLLISGMWAWWPRGSWRKAFRIRRTAPAVRALRDWHKLAGLGALLPLILLVLTGVMLALPDESAAVMTPMIGPADPLPAVRATPGGTGSLVPPSRAVAAAQARLPMARVAWIEVPGTEGPYRIRMQQPGDPSYRFPHSFVWIARDSANVLAVADTRRAGWQSTVINWLHPLHDGSFAGIGSRIATLLFGLAPLMLFVTGVWRWMARGIAGPFVRTFKFDVCTYPT